MKNKKKLFRWLKVIIICYSLIGIAVYYLQDTIFFQPTVMRADSSYHFRQPFTETDIYLDSATRLNIVRFTVPDSLRKGVVIYFHGNRANISRYNRFVDRFIKNHYEVWMPDYPGFGKSTGSRSEQLLYEEALQVYKLARKNFEPGQIIIYGKSMGTGIAAELASVRDCRRLILETPYYSLSSLARIYAFLYPVNLLIRYKMPTHDFLQKVTAPVSVFHGTSDGVIPYFNAKRLKNVLKPSDEFITIEGGTHRNLNTFPLMQTKLDSLLRVTM